MSYNSLGHIPSGIAWYHNPMFNLTNQLLITLYCLTLHYLEEGKHRSKWLLYSCPIYIQISNGDWLVVVSPFRGFMNQYPKSHRSAHYILHAYSAEATFCIPLHTTAGEWQKESHSGLSNSLSRCVYEHLKQCGEALRWLQRPLRIIAMTGFALTVCLT
jgi:hypothetical protein